MLRVPSLTFVAALVAVLLSGSAVSAQDTSAGVSPSASSTATSSAANPILAAPSNSGADAGAATPTVRRHRVISPEVAAQLSAAAPKFAPAAPKPPPVPDEDAPDMRDIDKPKNGIIRLPKYVVHEKPPPVLNERAVYTKQGLAELAMKRYFSQTDRVLNAFTLPLFGTSGESRAMAMYEEDERLKNMASLTDDARMVTAGDKAAGLYVKRQVDSTFMRQGDFDWKPIGR